MQSPGHSLDSACHPYNMLGRLHHVVLDCPDPGLIPLSPSSSTWTSWSKT
jgi:hypothetical protein